MFCSCDYFLFFCFFCKKKNTLWGSKYLTVLKSQKIQKFYKKTMKGKYLRWRAPARFRAPPAWGTSWRRWRTSPCPAPGTPPPSRSRTTLTGSRKRRKRRKGQFGCPTRGWTGSPGLSAAERENCGEVFSECWKATQLPKTNKSYKKKNAVSNS